MVLRRRWAAAGVLSAVLAVAGPSLRAQQPGTELRISVITIGPGAEVWERFGHNAIMVEDTVSGAAVWYNYGMFDFGAADFWPRFLRGDMRYWMQGGDVRQELGMYIRRNRSVWVQELALTPDERLELKRFLEWNALPENKYYHYDYYYDNCSTRVRDAIDRVVGGIIKTQTDTAPSGTTFRAETRRLTESSLPVYVGIELGLGRPTDRPISRYDDMFLPLALHDDLRRVRRDGPDGTSVPLVAAEETLYQSTAVPPPSAPPDWWPWFLLTGLVTGTTLLLTGARLGTSGMARFVFTLVGGLWSLFSGVGGILLAALWAFTAHTAAHANENLLQLSPLALPLAVALVQVARRPHEPHPLAARLALAVMLCSLAGLLVKLAPGAGQMNWEIIALALPINAALAIAVGRRAGARA